MELGYTPVSSKIVLHGGGHKKMQKGYFWGLFGIRLGRCPGIIPEKISFLKFYSRLNPNALALVANWTMIIRKDKMYDSTGSTCHLESHPFMCGDSDCLYHLHIKEAQ